MREKRAVVLRRESGYARLLVPLVIDQVTSLRERGVTECILSGPQELVRSCWLLLAT